MIKYGLKLWSGNSNLFSEAAALYVGRKIDCIELYNDPDAPLDFEALSLISRVPVMIHNSHSHGWHQFNLQKEQLEIWRRTLSLADYFKSRYIVVHPGQAPNLESFKKNYKKIDDPRIVLENMAGLDIYGENMYASGLAELAELRKIRPICFDFEKAVKSACFQKIRYQDFITAALEKLGPVYFHISGGDKNSPMDEHRDLWEANFDVAWIRKQLENSARGQDVILVFETPKVGGTLDNDLKNIAYFKGE